jgi:release factor glutamine methyltransferase
LIDLAVAGASESRTAASLKQGHWADLGTGSGAIAIGLADVFTAAIIHAVDYSHEALVVAMANARNLGFGERIRFYQGSWWQPLESLKGQFSGMVSNPPYIPTNIIPTLQLEVVNHEPHLALDGGADGLDCIRHLIEVSPTYLRPGGVWLIEMMAGQAAPVQEMLQNQGSYCNIQIHKDLAGIERFALAYKI